MDECKTSFDGWWYREERKPDAVPTGPRPTPEGEICCKHFWENSLKVNFPIERWGWTQARHYSCSRNPSSSLETWGRKLVTTFSIVKYNLWYQVAETYRKQETVVNFDTTSRRGGGDVRGYHNLSRNFATCYWIVDFSHAGRIFSSMIAFSVRSATLQARPSSQGTLIVGKRNTDGGRPLIGSSGQHQQMDIKCIESI